MVTRIHIAYVVITLFGVSLLPASYTRAQDNSAALADRAAQALLRESALRAASTRTVDDAPWRCQQLELRDETYPLVVDLLGSATQPATKVVYMLAGGSTNFAGSFFETPPSQAQSLARFFAEHGYLVVGVSPREDRVADALTDYAFMKDWGLAKHSADVRRVVSPLQAALGLPYEVLGHSYGAATALDFAARYGEAPVPERLIVLDIYSLDGEHDAARLKDAKRTYDAHVQLLASGQYVDNTYALLKPARVFAGATPSLDSGASRADFGHDGTFTFEGLYCANMMDSSKAAGVHTMITGLPGDWLFGGALAVGRYVFADDPLQDRYAFSHTRFERLLSSVDAVGSGLIAVALERDVWGVNAGVGYDPDWGSISLPVVWINSEHGYGIHRHAATRMRAAGNKHVVDDSVRGYGHGDLLWADTARFDLWERLLP